MVSLLMRLVLLTGCYMLFQDLDPVLERDMFFQDLDPVLGRDIVVDGVDVNAVNSRFDVVSGSCPGTGVRYSCVWCGCDMLLLISCLRILTPVLGCDILGNGADVNAVAGTSMLFPDLDPVLGCHVLVNGVDVNALAVDFCMSQDLGSVLRCGDYSCS